MSSARLWAVRAGKALIILLVTWGLFRATGVTLGELDMAELARLRPAPLVLGASLLVLMLV
jgi:hypothetical protein